MTRVAIVHDYLTQRGGAERVVLAMARAFPGAPVHTSLYAPDSTFPEFADVDVRPMALNRVGALRRDHRRALPLLAPAFSALRVDADVVLCSSSGWAHGVRTTGRKVVYCHNPARWLYQRDDYAPGIGVGRVLATGMGPPLRWWDRRSARSAERYLVNSSVVRERVRSAYGIDPSIVPPPYGTDPSGPQRPVDGCQPGAFLCVSRLMPYKHVGDIIAAMAMRPSDRLWVVGTGPEDEVLRRQAGGNVKLLGTVDDPALRWLYANCRGIVAASHEDFGLTPIEGAAFGRPSAVLRRGGFLDTVLEGRTGVFFDAPRPHLIAAALARMVRTSWDAAQIRAHAGTFDPESFAVRLRDAIGHTPRGHARETGP